MLREPPESAGSRAAAALRAIAEARSRKVVAERQTQLTYDAETEAHHALLSTLVSQYEERAIELAADEAPVSRWCQPLRPTEVTATGDGLELFWDADWPHQPTTHTVTWAELAHTETTHANG
jgi:hypothetical protein